MTSTEQQRGCGRPAISEKLLGSAQQERVEEIAKGLTKAAEVAVRTAAKMASGGTRVSWRTDQDTWHELERFGLLTPRTTPSLVSSYLSFLGIAVRTHLQGQAS